MNIVEREIAKRQVIVDGKAEKIEKLEALKAEVAELEAEVAAIDTAELEAEIAELKEVLHKLTGEEEVEPVEGETVETEIVEE